MTVSHQVVGVIDLDTESLPQYMGDSTDTASVADIDADMAALASDLQVVLDDFRASN